LVRQFPLGAIATQRPAAGMIHHSDRGSQYCAQEYTLLLDRFGMSVGNCYDYAPMESVRSVLKNEQIHHCQYATKQEVIQDITEFIETFLTGKEGRPALVPVSRRL